jgi:hypothetical protein
MSIRDCGQLKQYQSLPVQGLSKLAIRVVSGRFGFAGAAGEVGLLADNDVRLALFIALMVADRLGRISVLGCSSTTFPMAARYRAAA